MKPWLRQHGLLLVVLLGAVLLRLPLLNGSFWLDEAAQALESARPFSQQLQIAQDFQPPLLHLLLFPVIRLSTAESWLRLWGALIPGIITIWGTYALGKKIISKEAGIVAALLLSTSSFHIFYSQELRPYSLPAMWAVLSWLSLTAAVETDKHSSKEWFFYVLSTIGGLYSSYLYPFLLIAQFGWMLVQKRSRLVSFILNAATAGIAFLPWMPSFLEQLKVGGLLRTELPGWDQIVSTPQLKVLFLVPAKFIFGMLNVEPNLFFLLPVGVMMVMLLFSLLLIRHKLHKPQFSQPALLLAIWAVVPFVVGWLVSFFVPVVQPKRLLFILPALYLLLTHVWWTEKQAQKPVRPISFGVIMIILAINLFSTVQYYQRPIYQRENWRALHQEIRERYPADDSIAVFSFPGPFAPWRWYDDGSYPTFSTQSLSVQAATDLDQRFKTVSEYQYVLLFEYLRDLTDPEDQLRQKLWSYGYREVDVFNYPSIGFVRVFSRSRPTAQIPRQ